MYKSAQMVAQVWLEIRSCPFSQQSFNISFVCKQTVGKLALHLAIERQWPADIVKAIAAAHPEALRTLDPIKTKKGQTEPVAPLPKKGKGRWARGLAEEYHSSEDVLVLLPMPKKNKKNKEIDWIEPSALVDARKGHARAKKSKK